MAQGLNALSPMPRESTPRRTSLTIFLVLMFLFADLMLPQAVDYNTELEEQHSVYLVSSVVSVNADTSIEELAGIQQSQITNQSDLLDALNDEIVNETISEDEDDLMFALSLDAEEVIAPSPDAGGDQSLVADEDGTAIVTLDGSGTRDPQERITSWSWVDDSGKEVASTPVVRVRLNRGGHRMELRIKDRDGRWSSDSIDVRIE